MIAASATRLKKTNLTYSGKFRAELRRLDIADGALSRIPAAMTFRQWCESLAAPRLDPKTGGERPGLRVDGAAFSLADRPAMAWIYDRVPTTREEAFRSKLILRKCAQVGFTVMEILVAIYLALKFEPLKVGMFLPAMNLAQGKSEVAPENRTGG